jgi:virginiamycin B lyase
MNIGTNLGLTMLLAGATVVTVASAGDLSGVVRNAAGKPEANVFVTAHDAARKMSVSVLTDAGGRYRIDDLFGATYSVRARKAGFNDSTVDKVVIGERDGAADFELSVDGGAHLSTPGAAWLNVLPDEPMKATFISSCTICHDSASPQAHAPRDAAGWEAIIHQMRTQADAYSVIVPLDPKLLAAWLAKHQFGTKIAPFDPFEKSDNVVTNARISEYEVGDVTSWAHDMAVDPATGTAWVGDYVRDELISINPTNGEQKVYVAPIRGTGMHTLHFDRDDGSLWITLQLVHMVANFNPKSGEWRLYSGFTPGSLNHSFAYDSDGYVKKDAKGQLYIGTWGGNRTAMLDPKTGKVTEKQLPGPPTDKPYGIAVNSKGVVWYTKYSDNKMGYYDPSTGETKEWAMKRPDSAPHRMHIDDKDNLWIPLSGYGTVLRYSTLDGTEQEYKLPDADTFPYVLRYDRKTDRVWITGNGGNAIYALDPGTGKIQTFRMPSLLSYGRMVAIDHNTGDVWTALASYPNKLSLRDHSIIVRIHDAADLIKQAGRK